MLFFHKIGRNFYGNHDSLPSGADGVLFGRDEPEAVKQARQRDDAVQEMEKYIHAKNFSMIYFQPQTLGKSLEFLKRYPVKGQEAYDLQLVATMLSNGVTRIYTYDVSDFTKFQEIEVLSPETILK